MQRLNVATAATSWRLLSTCHWLLRGLVLGCAIRTNICIGSGEKLSHERVHVDAEVEPAVTLYHLIWDANVHLRECN